MTRKHKILGVLVAILAISVVYRIQHPFQQQRVETLTYTNAPKTTDANPREPSPKGSESAVISKTALFLESFQKPVTHSGNVIKDLFGNMTSISGGSPALTNGPAKASVEKPVPASGPQTVVEDVVNDELGSFRVFGFYTDGKDVAIFLKRGKDVLVVRQGDKIDGKYLVETLTPRTIVLKAEHIHEMVHIDLTEFLSQFESAQLSFSGK